MGTGLRSDLCIMLSLLHHPQCPLQPWALSCGMDEALSCVVSCLSQGGPARTAEHDKEISAQTCSRGQGHLRGLHHAAGLRQQGHSLNSELMKLYTISNFYKAKAQTCWGR